MDTTSPQFPVAPVVTASGSVAPLVPIGLDVSKDTLDVCLLVREQAP